MPALTDSRLWSSEAERHERKGICEMTRTRKAIPETDSESDSVTRVTRFPARRPLDLTLNFISRMTRNQAEIVFPFSVIALFAREPGDDLRLQQRRSPIVPEFEAPFSGFG